MNEIAKAAALLRAGKLVAFPTETVYGLGADALNPEAVKQIFIAKKRPFDHPLIVHMANVDEINAWASDVSPIAWRLAQAFWPGPLTLILKRQAHVPDLVTAGQETVGLRIPRHPVAQALLREFGGGIAAPSANQFTRLSPTTSEAVREELGDQVAMILEGGECEVGLESTIIDVSGDVLRILRPGMIDAAAIEAIAQSPVLMPVKDQTEENIRVPGMHHVHYAPRTPTILMTGEKIVALTNITQKTAILMYSQLILKAPQATVIVMPNNAKHYAHDLYQTLRSLDNERYTKIIIEAVPSSVEWDAIRDRLIKASGSR